MKDIHLTVFIDELKRQCNFAIYSYRQILVHIEKTNINEIWFYIQGVLVATGNISKMLWNSNESIKGRSKTLRTVLGVHDNSPLKNRNMRNNFEHYDERLEKWADTAGNLFFSNNVGILETFEVQGLDSNSCLRHLNPATLQLLFKGNEFDLPSIMIEVNKLYLCIQEYLHKSNKFD